MRTPQKTQNPTSPFRQKKSLGQNFLTSNVVPSWLVEAAKLRAGDVVLEIGPGTGALTRELLSHDIQIIAVEADERAVAYLQTEFSDAIQAKKLILHHSDARELALEKLGLANQEFIVVANIPYYLSGFLLRQLLDTKVQPKTLVFLMQKELVERVVRDKKSSLLSLSVRAFGEPAYIKTVSRGHFRPLPKVDSAILAVYNINQQRLAEIGTSFFFSLLHAGFGKKRKQLVANLSDDLPRSAVTQALASLEVSPTVRAEDLDLTAWLKLAAILKSTP